MKKATAAAEVTGSVPEDSGRAGSAPKLGVLIHEQFPFGALGIRQWSSSEMRRLLRWFKSLGYTQAVFLSLPFTEEEDEFNILELTALYESGIRPRTGFRPGNAYDPADRYLGGEEGMARARRMKAAMEYCREIGMAPWLQIKGELGSPQFCEEHPELMAIDSHAFSMEGFTLCPSKPAALEHLLRRTAEHLRFLSPALEGVHLVFRDGGSCNCALCQPPARVIGRLSAAYFGMIRQLDPRMPVVFLSHHVHVSEVPILAQELPKEMWIAESLRTQTLDVPREDEVRRIRTWQAQGRHVEMFMALQENSTALLPTVYPKRVAEAVALAHELALSGLWVGSTLNPYVFPMHWWMLPRLWSREAPVAELMRRYFLESFGAAAVEPGLRWAEAMEGALNLVQAQSQRDAGFLKIFVINFPARMLPEKCIQLGVPEQFRRDMSDAVRLAAQALEAAEAFADAMREYHALDANTIVAGTEVFAHYLRMRHAKIAVLDALHDGDALRAVHAFGPVEEECRKMVACSRDAPNTDLLASHWRRLDLLPERLASLRKLLPELAEKKRFRSVMVPLEQSQQPWAQKGGTP